MFKTSQSLLMIMPLCQDCNLVYMKCRCSFVFFSSACCNGPCLGTSQHRGLREKLRCCSPLESLFPPSVLVCVSMCVCVCVCSYVHWQLGQLHNSPKQNLTPVSTLSDEPTSELPVLLFSSCNAVFVAVSLLLFSTKITHRPACSLSAECSV